MEMWKQTQQAFFQIKLTLHGEKEDVFKTGAEVSSLFQ